MITATELENSCADYRLITALNRRVNLLHWLHEKTIKHSHKQLQKTIEDILEPLELLQTIALGTIEHAPVREINSVISSRQLQRSTITQINAHFRKYGKTKKELYAKLRLKDKKKKTKFSKFQKALATNLLEGSRNARKCDIIERLKEEVLLASKKGWFMVFSTLTVSNENYETVFKRKSTAFKDFIRSTYRSIGTNMGLTSRQADIAKKDIHRYFAVVERGTLGGRLHIHCLHLCKQLPHCARDNLNAHNRTTQNIEALNKFWKYEGSNKDTRRNHLAMRYSHNDAYGKAGWLWPMVKTTCGIMQPMQTCSPMRIANYVSKYITKSYEELKKWKLKNPQVETDDTMTTPWRTRMTRNFGLDWIMQHLAKLPVKTLLASARTTNTHKYVRRQTTLPNWKRVRMCILRLCGQRRILKRNFLTYREVISFLKPSQKMTETSLLTLRTGQSKANASQSTEGFSAFLKAMRCIKPLEHNTLNIGGRTY